MVFECHLQFTGVVMYGKFIHQNSLLSELIYQWCKIKKCFLVFYGIFVKTGYFWSLQKIRYNLLKVLVITYIFRYFLCSMERFILVFLKVSFQNPRCQYLQKPYFPIKKFFLEKKFKYFHQIWNYFIKSTIPYQCLNSLIMVTSLRLVVQLWPYYSLVHKVYLSR